MAEITCINSGKRHGLQVFLQPIKTTVADFSDAAFFGVIWAEKEELTKEVEEAYREVTLAEYPKTTDEAENFFEHCLQKLNSSLAGLLVDKNFLNLIFGLKLKDRILFSYAGKILVIFIERKISGEISVSPLNALPQGKEENFFSNFIAGNLNARQSIFFSTNNINTYFTPLRVATLLFASPNALWQIKDAVAKIDPSLPFAGLHILYKNKEAFSSAASLANLVATEAETEKILTPPILPNLAPALKRFAELSKKGIRLIVRKAKKTSAENFPKIKPVIKAVLLKAAQLKPRLPKLNLSASKFSPEKVASKLASLPDRTRVISKQTASFFVRQRRIHLWWKISLDRLIGQFNLFEPKAKALIILAAALIFLFAQSLLYLGFTQKTRQTQKLTNDEIAKIQSNITGMKASLMYGDETQAKSVFASTQAAAQTLLNNSKIVSEEKNKILKDLQDIENALRRVVVLEPKSLYEFKEQKQPNGILALSGAVYLLSENSLLEYNPASGALEVLYQNLTTSFSKIAADEERKLVFLASQNKIITFNARDKSTDEKNINLSNLRDITGYGRRLYALAGEPLKIIRLTKTEDAFASMNWLKDKINLDDAISLAVDGEIYIIKKPTDLLKFLSGRKREFKLAQIEPALAEPNKILTSPESDYLYILESAGNRVVVFDKKGTLRAQYVADKIGKIIDFAADEGNKKLYILSETGLFEADINSLK